MGQRILTAAELMAASPATVDVECAAWSGTVRLARLSPAAKLRLALRAGTLTKDDGGNIQMLDAGNWDFAVDVVAESVVDEGGTLQFSEPSARAWLCGEINAVSELLSAAMRLNRLGGAEIDADAEAAKND